MLRQCFGFGSQFGGRAIPHCGYEGCSDCNGDGGAVAGEYGEGPLGFIVSSEGDGVWHP